MSWTGLLSSEAEVLSPQVEFVSVKLTSESRGLNVHQGRYSEAVVQLKIIRLFLSERKNAFKGIVVIPPITLSEK